MDEAYALAYEKRPTMVVRFSLSGDELSPAIITEQLGIPPSESWRKGDAVPISHRTTFEPRKTRMFGRWALSPNCSPYDDFEAQLESLLSMLAPVAPILRTLAVQYNGEIKVAYSSGESNFGFHLSAELINRLQTLAVAVDFDIYPVVDDSATTDDAEF